MFDLFHFEIIGNFTMIGSWNYPFNSMSGSQFVFCTKNLNTHFHHNHHLHDSDYDDDDDNHDYLG